VTDFLDEKRQEITSRLKELQPMVDEFRRLEAAAVALAGVGGSSRASTTKRRRGPGRPRGSSTRTARATKTTRAKPAKARATKARATKARATKARATKARATKARATKARATKARATKARVTKTRATKARPARKAARPTARRAGRRKGSGTRAAEANTLVKGQPGITIPELAARMGIKQNYLYRVLPGLEQEGKVSKRGRGWYPKG
jgi:hypothetical protein